MPSHMRFRLLAVAFGALLCLLCAGGARAQDVDGTGEEQDDPAKLLQQGRAAQARNELERALTLYNEALKLRPEYPEAELQKGLVLTSLNRLPEAERALRRAAQLRAEWVLPQTALGLLFLQQKRDKDAEPFLRRALALDPDDTPSLVALGQIYVRAGEKEAALAIYKRATGDESADADAWAARGSLERDAGDTKAAAASLRRALQLDPNNVLAREERAELRAADSDYARAIEDVQFLLSKQPQSPHAKVWQQRIAEFQAMAARPPGAGLSAGGGPPNGGVIRVETLEAANSDDPKIARAALIEIVTIDPKNAPAHARLCVLDRVTDTQSALEHCRSAVELEPKNSLYASAYAGALVQARRFNEAVPLLRKVIEVAPDNYPAHANLATALDELKDYAAALVEYRWLNRTKPDLAAVYFFIARDLDLLGEYEQALAAYETFLARADAVANKEEIERVQLRLPPLRKQVARGEKRRKP